MLRLALYIRDQRVLFDCPSAQVGGEAQRPRSAATPGAVGLAGQNAAWSASTRRVRPASLSLLLFFCAVSIGAASSPFSLGPGPGPVRRSAFRRPDSQPPAQSRRPVCAIA